jgi:hypothetical protein
VNEAEIIAAVVCLLAFAAMGWWLLRDTRRELDRVARGEIPIDALPPRYRTSSHDKKRRREVAASGAVTHGGKLHE